MSRRGPRCCQSQTRPLRRPPSRHISRSMPSAVSCGRLERPKERVNSSEMSTCLDSTKAKRLLDFKPAYPKVEVGELRKIVTGFQGDEIWLAAFPPECQANGEQAKIEMIRMTRVIQSWAVRAAGVHPMHSTVDRTLPTASSGGRSCGASSALRESACSSHRSDKIHSCSQVCNQDRTARGW